MPSNVQTMAYVGQVPWHGLGEKVEKAVHAEEMISAAGLDREVKKQPAPEAKRIRKRANGEELFSRYKVVRMPRDRFTGLVNIQELTGK